MGGPFLAASCGDLLENAVSPSNFSTYSAATGHGGRTIGRYRWQLGLTVKSSLHRDRPPSEKARLVVAEILLVGNATSAQSEQLRNFTVETIGLRQVSSPPREMPMRLHGFARTCGNRPEIDSDTRNFQLRLTGLNGFARGKFAA